MGMSASQARLIALTARMNDIEYQGQQINQQRTTLSNQINALYSSLLDMQVPTPPAKSDFTIVEYGGNMDASKFKLGTVTPAGKYPDSDIQLYNIDINYETTGLAMNKETGKVPLKFTPGKQYYTLINSSDPRVDNLFNTETNAEIKDDNPVVDFSTVTSLGIDQNIMFQIDVSQLTNSIKEEYGNKLYVANEDGKTYSQITEDKIPSSGSIYVFLNSSNFANPSAAGSLKDLIFDGDNIKSGLTGYKTHTGNVEIPNKDANLDGLYVLLNGQPVKLTFEILKNLDPNNLKIYGDMTRNIPEGTENVDYITETFGDGKPLLTVGTSGTVVYDANSDEAKAQLDSVENCRTALMNSFPKIAQNLANGDDILDKFYVYFEITQSGKPKPHFIIKSDIETQLNSNTLNANTYEFDEDGKYTDSQEKKGCRLEFDSSGRITQIGIPVNDGEGNILNWTWVKLTMTESTDNDAYEDAFNEYEYKKYLYDKEQQAINAKTSIIQSEDKNLELKLTRLDNERNAVKTEIDAVKKVVDDNIEKSFKTFSG